MINCEVKLKPKESIESLMSRFSKNVRRSKILKELKMRQRFLNKKEKNEFKKRDF